MEKIDVKQELKEVLKRIKTTRKESGYSLETMGDALNLSESGYRKIEENESSLSLERFLQIAKELKVSARELVELETKRDYHQHNHEKGTFIGHQEFENYYQENKEMTNKLINSYEENKEMTNKLINNYETTIQHQKEEILFLRSQLADMLNNRLSAISVQGFPPSRE